MQPKRILIVTSLVLLTAACGSSSSSSAKPRASARTSASPTSTTSAAPQTPNGSPCGKPGAAPRTYESVVVFSFENRSWDEVGLGFGEPMPYLHDLGTQCSWFAQWDEIDPHEKSLAQYVGQIIGSIKSESSTFGFGNRCSVSCNYICFLHWNKLKIKKK